MRIFAVFMLSCACSLFAQEAAPKPAVLFLSQEMHPYNVYGPSVDLTYASELHKAGFEVDYAETPQEATWTRIKEFNCLVIQWVPSDPNALKKFTELIERFLAEGGGVFVLTAFENHPDQYFRPLIEPWGARIPFERFREGDAKRIAAIPNMREEERMALVDEIPASPVSAGVQTLWVPYMDFYFDNTVTSPLALSKEWKTVVQGSATSFTEPVLKSIHPLPEGRLVRPEGEKRPTLIALREYKAGRVFLCPQWSQFTVGQGTQWLYDRAVLSTGANGVKSDFAKLFENTYRWLSEPSLGKGKLGGFQTKPERLLPTNLRKDAMKEYLSPAWAEADLSPKRGQPEPKLFRGLIGAQTVYSGGQGTVEEYAAAARKAGLHFLAFMEDFNNLSPENLKKLDADCRRCASEDLLLYPGYSIDTNAGNHMFIYGNGVVWPDADCLTGPGKKLLNIQQQDETGKFVEGNRVLGWIFGSALENDPERTRNVGFYHFTDNPSGLKLQHLRMYSAAGVRYYENGKLVEDVTDDYLLSAFGSIPPQPVSVNRVRSPGELAQAVASHQALTYAQANSLKTLWKDALQWSHQYSGPNIFSSDGPLIKAWPVCYRVWNFGAEPFVLARDFMPAELWVTSEAGLKELKIYDGNRLFRRFLPGGAKEFHEVLQLAANNQRDLVLVAEDIDGRKAVSFARRCWKDGANAIMYCGDHINDIGVRLAHGPAFFPVTGQTLIPQTIAGVTWDGGPPGVKNVVHSGLGLSPAIHSNLGIEGERAFNNIPILEAADDQATRVRTLLTTVYDERVPVINPWYTHGPIEPSKLIEATLRHCEWLRAPAGVVPSGWAAEAVRKGSAVALFESFVTSKQAQTITSLRIALMKGNLWGSPLPLFLSVRDAKGAWSTREISPGQPERDIAIGAGEWFGIYSPKTSNSVLFANAGEPIHVSVKNPATIEILASAEGRIFEKGATLHYALFSITDALDQTERGEARFAALAKFIEAPEGLKVLRGERKSGVGCLDFKAVDGAIELQIPKPPKSIDCTLPVRVAEGLNPRWSAGVFQKQGYCTGYYGKGMNGYSPVGLDFDGRACAALFVDRAPLTHIVVGHPITCTQPEVFIEATPRPGSTPEQWIWHVTANNPTDAPVEATFHQAMDLPGLKFAERTVKIPAGGLLVLQEK